MDLNPNNQINLEADSVFKEMIYRLGKRLHIKKGESILKQGDNCNFFFFVENGAFRAFRYVGEDEVTIGFSFKGDIDTCPHSFINGLPSVDIIEALSDSVIYKITAFDFREYIKQHPQLNTISEKLLADYAENLITRLIALKKQTAETNYLTLLQRQTDQVRHIPLQYIASYLGISKERLSRIRKKINLI